MSIVENLITEVVAALPAEHPPAGVRIIHVDIGEFSGIEPDALSFAFECLAPDSLLSQARLDIHRIRSRWRCTACDAVQEPAYIGAPCRDCGQTAGHFEGGGELLINRIEVE